MICRESKSSFMAGQVKRGILTQTLVQFLHLNMACTLQIRECGTGRALMAPPSSTNSSA